MALPIDHDQTISQPFTVAFMCEAAELAGRENVLEVGTGSGYGAAILAELADHVHTVERIPQLAEQARDTLGRLGYGNVIVHLANGTLGLPEAAPFDVIVVTAGAEALPKPYLDQLAAGGRIVIPIGYRRYGQTMYRFTFDDDKLRIEDLGAFAFVPLIGDHGS
jgi:protein-L-isoaspartate(D-aspartate) O-methyltransferase